VLWRRGNAAFSAGWFPPSSGSIPASRGVSPGRWDEFRPSPCAQVIGRMRGRRGEVHPARDREEDPVFQRPPQISPALLQRGARRPESAKALDLAVVGLLALDLLVGGALHCGIQIVDQHQDGFLPRRRARAPTSLSCRIAAAFRRKYAFSSSRERYFVSS
jgi:hypothetical protein